MTDDILNNITTLPDSLKSARTSYYVIAGPCSAETEKQTVETAVDLQKIGVKVFRAGLWKPRTRPDGFEGVGNAGLKWLSHVKQETGMLLATEVATREHVAAALDSGIEIVWIGARTSTNPFAVQEIADALRDYPDTTVLVKNPVNPDIELWIGALQRIALAGIKKIGAIHRGFSSYGNHIYRNTPQWRIAIELQRRLPNLSILCDPSHMGGNRELITPLSQQSLDMGFNGLFIEAHCCPEKALSDPNQQITPAELDSLLNTLIIRRKQQSTDNLQSLRLQIDQCDNELIEILSKRMSISREIGTFKKEHDMQVVQTDRYDEILKHRVAQAQEMGMSPTFMKSVMSVIHEESVRQQLEILSNRVE